MALINCPECGREISDSAFSCPHCGYPLKERDEEQKVERRSSGLSIASFVLSIIVLFMFLGMFRTPSLLIPMLIMVVITVALSLVDIIASKKVQPFTIATFTVILGIILIICAYYLLVKKAFG